MAWADGSTQRRIERDRARRKATRRQKQHLRSIKSEAQLRAILLGSRHIGVRRCGTGSAGGGSGT